MLQDLNTAPVWLAATALLLLALVIVFSYELARRNRDVLLGALNSLDALLSAKVPQLWGLVKRRFSRHAPLGLALTVATALLFGAVYLFAEVTEGWMDQGELYRIDRVVNRRLPGALGEGVLDALRLVTHLGDVLTLVAISLALALWMGKRKAWWELLALLLVSAGGQALVWTLKWIFARDRPGGQLTSAVGSSFPSGHSFTAVVLYGFLLYLAWQHIGRPAWRVPAAVALVLVILGVGASRVLLSVHWISDVLGGFAIGLAWLVFSLAVVHLLEAYRARGFAPPRA